MLLVGRHNYCDIPLGLASVSGRHCELEFLDGFWYVRDLGSSNGTRINGVLCTRTERLLPNDVLSLAKNRFTVMYTPPVGRLPAQPVKPSALMKGGPAPQTETVAKRIDKPAAAPAKESPGGGPSLGKLVPCGGGIPIPLRKPRLVVGRIAACDIVLPIASISSRHCELEWKDGQWFVRDLGSTNGVRVDGIRCESKALPSGSILTIANIRYQVVYSSAEAAGKPSVFGQTLLEKAGLTNWRPEPTPSRKTPASDEDDKPRRITLDDSE
jgi:adenylate cyclase